MLITTGCIMASYQQKSNEIERLQAMEIKMEIDNEIYLSFIQEDVFHGFYDVYREWHLMEVGDTCHITKIGSGGRCITKIYK